MANRCRSVELELKTSSSILKNVMQKLWTLVDKARSFGYNSLVYN